MDTKLDRAIHSLTVVRRKMAKVTSEHARWRYRRIFFARLKATRRAMEEEFPRPIKWEPPAEPKPKKPKREKLPGRAFDIDVAKLFASVAVDILGLRHRQILIAHENARYGKNASHAAIYFSPDWSDQRKWMQILWGLGSIDIGHTKEARVMQLFRRFWVEQLPVSDVPTAAAHLALLEKQQARSAAAHRAIATRKARVQSEAVS